ncbi:MAG TPA: PKD domain-containing protein [Candidatus Margulisiibacteriota bacterium]|nr:PKD domain-containing protein [Candidatus Margulisiibacteriota bacterium]
MLRTYGVLLPLLLWLVGGVTACSSGCNRPEEASSSPSAGAASSGAKAGTPTALAPRSHQLIEQAGGRLTPLRGVQVTPGLGAQAAQESDRLWVSASGDPDTGGVPLTVSFTGEIQGGGPDLRYRWDFGDNSPPAYQLNVQHTYREAGDYTATLSVTGTDAEDSDEVTIQVSEEGFDVSIDADPDIGKVPLTVHFSAVLDEDLPGPFYYQWDFGDGGRDVTNPTTHTYRLAGEYTATCVVTNSQGQTGREEVEIQVDTPDADQETQ